MSENELPEGWAIVSIADFCEAIQSGSTPSAELFKSDGGVPFLKVYNIVNQVVAFDYRSQFVSEETHRTVLKRAHVVPGDVLMNIVGPPLGKVAIVPDDYPEWNINQAIVLFRPGSKLDRHFLYFLLCSGIPYEKILAETRGSAGQANISLSQCRGMDIPLPPLAEQKRIVEKLELLLGKVSSSQQRLSRVPALLKRFRQSVLAAACSGKLTADWRAEHPSDEVACSDIESICEIPAEWRWTLLDTLCDQSRGICYGVIKLGEPDPNGVPCLRTSDVKPLRIETASVKRISRQISDEFQRSILRSNEVLVNVRGTLGGVAVAPACMRGWNVSREVAVVPVVKVVPQFIANWIATQFSQNWLQGVAKGVAYTGINLEDLRLLPVPLPSTDEQHEIVRRVEKLLAFADQIEARLKQARTHVDRLTQSILAKAFTGELVPTEHALAEQEGREYEPASVLLERLRQQPAAEAPAPRKKKAKS